MLEELQKIEKRADESPAFKNIEIAFDLEDKHLQLGGYELHKGLRPNSKHWRKPKCRGCYHITVHRSGPSRIHWDAWDPRRYPVMHSLEVVYRFFLVKWAQTAYFKCRQYLPGA